MSDPLYLGLDLGTSAVKALIADAGGRVIAAGSAPVGVRHLEGGAVEQDIEEIWAAALDALTQAARDTSASRVAAVGVSSQGGALQLQDAWGTPAGPVIGWQDGRGAAWDARLSERHDARWFERRTGARAPAGSIGQLARLRESGALSEATRVGWVGDVIVGRLCGRAAHDATSISEAHLYNPTLGCADPELLALLGLSCDRLPDLLDTREVAGRLGPAVAARTGLPPGIPVGPAVHDQYAAAIGCGVTGPGDVMLGTGTAWVLLAAADHLPRATVPGSIACRHPAGSHGLLVSVENGGSGITWALATLGLGHPAPEAIDRLLGGVKAGCDGLRCWPLLSAGGGEGLAPHTAGRLDGLRLGHGPPHILRAVVEGLACELARYLGMMRSAGVTARRLVMCGKAAASEVTPQVVAGVTGCVVDCAAFPETTALGAAILGRGLVDRDHSLRVLSAEMKPPVRRVEPPAEIAVLDLAGEYLAGLRKSGVTRRRR